MPDDDALDEQLQKDLIQAAKAWSASMQQLYDSIYDVSQASGWLLGLYCAANGMPQNGWPPIEQAEAAIKHLQQAYESLAETVTSLE